MNNAQFIKWMREEKAAFVDFRFTDFHGRFHHITVPVGEVDADFLSEGKSFDGSSIPGWRSIEDSDMLLMPDPASARIDPFVDEKTVIVVCDVYQPSDKAPYVRCPRSIAKRAMAYLKKTGIGDAAIFGPEPEFFVFDSVQWTNAMHDCGFKIHSEEGAWASGLELEGFNSGHRPGVKGGYFPSPPVDSLVDLRNEMCIKMREMGVIAEVHHHEVATAGQCEIGSRGGPPVERGDASQFLKYVVHNVAQQFGKTATFMPKPLRDDNGSGMHVHQSISKKGRNIFQGKLYGGLSQEALWYIGGIMKHSRALNAITNASTNSYRRLMPGFEAPVKLAYSARNRSASIRIPHSSAKSRRVETRFPDPSANSYLCFAALMLAGLDGIKKKTDPGRPSDFNLYHDSRSADRAAQKIGMLSGSLADALAELDKDRGFLTDSGVFTNDCLDAYISVKNAEVSRFRASPQPVEFEMYYSC